MTRAGSYRPAVHEHARTIEARNGHGATRHVLVATAHGNDAVKALSSNDSFDGVGDDLARHERIAHAGRAHRNAIRDSDGVEQHCLAAGGISTGRCLLGQLADMHVARGDIGPGAGDTDLRFAEVGIGKAHGPQHGA